jgi:alpha-1,2-mannosyltransferase
MRSASRFPPRTLVRALAVLSLITALIVSIQQQQRTENKLRDPAGGHISDFDRWMIMTPRFVHEHADYVNDDLPTPPLTLMIFAPLAALGRPNAALAWVLLKVPVVFGVFALTVAMIRRAGVQLTAAGILIIVAGWWLPVIVDLQEGQTNFIALLPLMAGLWYAQRQTAAADAAAGMWIGLAIAAKLTPVVFVAYFLWRRRWTIAAVAVVSTAAWWLVIPALMFGWEQNLKWFEQWARIMILPYVTRGEVVYSTSQSVGSFVLRLLTESAAFDSHHGGITESHYMNVAALGNDAVRRIVRVLTIGAGLVGLWWARRPLPSFASRRYIVEIGAVAAFMLWFSERTWVHHYVSFVLMLGAAAMLAGDAAVPQRIRRLVTTAAVVFFVCTLWTSEAGKLFGRDGIDWVKAFGAFLFPSMALTLTVMMAAEARPAGADT